MRKNITITVIVLIFILSVLYMVGSYKKGDTDRLVLTIKYGDGKEQNFYAKFQDKKRAWSVLQQATTAAGIALEPTFDFWPQRIDGFKNGTDGKNWNFYLNDVKQTESPYNIQVESPDDIDFRFE